MRLKVLLGALMAFTIVSVFILCQKEERRVLLNLKSIEALADPEDYHTGMPGTNWKEYQTDCTYTIENGVKISVGLPGGIVSGEISSSKSSTWTEKNKSVCGSGGGFCLSPAGC